MNNRLKSLAVTVFVIILITNFVSAIQVTDIAQGLETNNAEISSLKQEVNSKFSLIDKKLDETATADEMRDLLTAHLIKTNEIIENFRSWLVVSFIITGLCLIGFAYSIFFYFKSRGRL